jgi:uncharacterized protein (TIGR03085 family)
LALSDGVASPCVDDRDMLARMPSLSSIERMNLVAALRDAGPDAPTLCAGWTARDLAAHLAVRERRADAGPALVLGGGPNRWTERVRRRYAAKDWDALVGLVADGPPLLSGFALPGVDASANLTEHFVHCEDVRRARPGWAPRELAPGLQDALWKLVQARAGMFFRRSRVGLLLATPDGRRQVAVDKEPSVTLTGEPAELTLYAFGRTAHARVEFDGPPDAVATFRKTPLGV